MQCDWTWSHAVEKHTSISVLLVKLCLFAVIFVLSILKESHWSIVCDGWDICHSMYVYERVVWWGFPFPAVEVDMEFSVTMHWKIMSLYFENLVVFHMEFLVPQSCLGVSINLLFFFFDCKYWSGNRVTNTPWYMIFVNVSVKQIIKRIYSVVLFIHRLKSISNINCVDFD